MECSFKTFATRIAVGAISGFIFVSTAQADHLSRTDAMAFAKCLPEFQEAGERLEKSGQLKVINDEMDGLKVTDGKLKMYSAPMARLKEVLPATYAEFDGIAKTCGMGSITKLTSVGDRVMAAYLSRLMPPETAQQLSAMSPEMMATMPPPAQQSFAMIRALDNVPDADKKLLDAELVALLDKHTGIKGDLDNAPGLFGQ